MWNIVSLPTQMEGKKRRKKETGFNQNWGYRFLSQALRFLEVTSPIILFIYLTYCMWWEVKITFFVIEKWSWIDPFTFFKNFDREHSSRQKSVHSAWKNALNWYNQSCQVIAPQRLWISTGVCIGKSSEQKQLIQNRQFKM